jgi:murein DD-endopeptidase MepM/ murein hydrolase activator NlpD
MEVILVSHKRGRTWKFQLELLSLRTWLPLAAAMTVFGAVLLAAGYWLRPVTRSVIPQNVAGNWSTELDRQRAELAQTRAAAEENARALSRRIAMLNAEVMRLDAAGSRMISVAHIDPAEFSFDKPPPVGGPASAGEAAQPPVAMTDVLASLDSLEQRLNDREREMRVLEDLLLSSRMQKEVRPSGWPVAEGYITSPFGFRTDPFTGLRSNHPGIDFAAAEGSNVLAVASGIVTKAGEEEGYDGYGRIVEINHGNGYATRYGHNERVLVHIGDRVRRGQVIAKMGSTGRSTGPHVHFEVLLNGVQVNPERYIEASR